jgi:hypothetical protein
VSVLNAFLSTWSNARQTYGEGTPQTGAHYDGSSTLNQLQSTVQTAAPRSKWTGSAANAYGAANTEHGRVLGQLAGLDQRLSAHVDQSAEVVAAGRRDLDAVRKWVVDAAANVPQNAAGERMQMAIVQKGLSQVQEIIQRSNGELNSIGGKIRGLGNEYQALGNQKFGGLKEGGEGEALGVKGDEAEEAKKRAEEDVRQTLEKGDQQAAARVDDVLRTIVPGQKLSPEQDAYLSQMESQQRDMSVDDLKVAQDKLGDHKNVVGDAWQLMSNDDVYFGESDENGNQAKGSFDRLPESVQKAISISNLDYPAGEVERRQIQDVADIVRNGDSKFQTGTEIDREMIRLSDRLMDQSPVNESTVRDLFTSAGRDHQIITDHMVGWQPNLDDPNAPGTVPYDYNSDDFLSDIMKTGWSDDGKDAASLFSWTNEQAHGPQAGIASAAAERYAQFIGSHQGELMDIPNAFGMTDTLGQVNPELVKGMAHGLTPYMADIAGVEGGAADNFQPLETDQTRPVAKGIFAVLGTDVDAYREFNGAANELALQKSYEWASDVKQGHEVFANDARMNAAATLKGLMDHGTAEGLKTIGLQEQQMTDLKKSVYNEAVSALSAAGGPYGKAIGMFGGALEDSFFGNGSDISGDVKPMFADESARLATNALLAAGVEVPGTEPFLVQDTDANGQPFQRLMTLEELRGQGVALTADNYGGDLNRWLEEIVGVGRSPAGPFGEQYEDVTQ